MSACSSNSRTRGRARGAAANPGGRCHPQPLADRRHNLLGEAAHWLGPSREHDDLAAAVYGKVGDRSANWSTVLARNLGGTVGESCCGSHGVLGLRGGCSHGRCSRGWPRMGCQACVRSGQCGWGLCISGQVGGCGHTVTDGDLVAAVRMVSSGIARWPPVRNWCSIATASGRDR
jgi:hypothetical protein